MSHLPVLPIAIPALSAALLLVLRHASVTTSRTISLVSTASILACAVALAAMAGTGAHLVYAIGDWPAPFGIVLVVDRMSALMLVLTSVLALSAAWYATAEWDTRGPYFHPLFQLQLMGLNGAFLTGDLFNLFVFFEVLLIASYCLLLHGLGKPRLVAAVHYVVINLTGSALFLVAAALFYGVAGTLNMAQLAERVAQASTADLVVLRSAGLLLIAVFALKAAVFPLYFWLPRAYAAASAPVAALFSVMTKVGVYAIARVTLLVFGAQDITAHWLLPAALVTLLLSTLGALGAQQLGTAVAYLVLNSVGTMLTAVALGGERGLSAALYYLAHSVLVLGALFLLVELIARQRGDGGDRLRASQALLQPATLGFAFLVAGAAVAGLPPFSGFVGKVMVLGAVFDAPVRLAVWTVVLGTSFLTVLALARAGSVLFWKQTAPHPEARADRIRARRALPLGGLLACVIALAVLAAPAKRYTDAAARQLLAPASYVNAVLHGDVDRAPRSLDTETRR